MLVLFGVPIWKVLGLADAPLPASLPACLLIYLACEDRWLDREAVASVFWPDRSPDDARHNLRVNLHRGMARLRAALGLAPTANAELTHD